MISRILVFSSSGSSWRSRRERFPSLILSASAISHNRTLADFAASRISLFFMHSSIDKVCLLCYYFSKQTTTRQVLFSIICTLQVLFYIKEVFTMERKQKYPPDNSNKFFPTRLTELTRERGGQSDLAKAIGKTRQMINHYCNGKYQPDCDTLVSIAQHYDVSIDWLLGVKNAPKKTNPEKKAVMEYTKLSEHALDNLMHCMDVVDSATVNVLLGANRLDYAVALLSDARYLVKNATSEYYRIPGQKDIVMQTNELVYSIISRAFSLLTGDIQDDFEILLKLSIAENGNEDSSLDNYEV